MHKAEYIFHVIRNQAFCMIDQLYPQLHKKRDDGRKLMPTKEKTDFQVPMAEASTPSIFKVDNDNDKSTLFHMNIRTYDIVMMLRHKTIINKIH